MRGEDAQLEPLTQALGVLFMKVAEGGPDYTVDHSAQTLVFDTRGRLRLMLPYGTAADKIASDLKILLNS